MSDGVTFQTTNLATPADGVKVSTDDSGPGGHVQRVKLAQSADGSEVHVQADADGLLVNLGTNNDVTVAGGATAANQATIIGHVDGIETVLGTIDTDTGNIATSAATVAGAVSGAEMQVDVVTMPTVTVTGGLTDAQLRASAVPVSLASVPSHAVTNAGTFAVQATLQAGAASVGTLGANSGVDIGDVTINNASGAAAVNVQDGGNSLTVDGTVTANLAAGTANIGDVDVLTVPAPLSTTGTGTEATALRVTVATDSTGVLSVDDNGSSLTVDGTVAATQSGAWNVTNVSGTVSLPTGAATLAEQQTQTASLSVIDDWDESDRAKVNLIVGQAGIAGGTGVDSATVPRVTLATNVALPAGSNAIGKLAANAGVTIGAVEIAAAQTLATVTTVGAVTGITNALPAGTNLIGKVDHASTGIGDGRTVVTTAGTRVALAGSTVAKTVVMTAETDNTGVVVVGAAATVVAALATRRGTPLSAGESLSLPIDNLADVGLDSTVNGDGVTYVYTT